MTDERDRPSDSGGDPAGNLDNKMDSLLPSPENGDEDSVEAGQVDGPIDELLPKPGKPDESEDDASTREELEVDTTADGEDDFIPLHEDQTANADRNEGSTPSQCLMCGSDIGTARFCPRCGTEQVPASRIFARLAPLFMWSRPLPIRAAFSAGLLLTLLALLANSGTTALIISASTLPIVILIRLADQLGGLSRNSWVQVAMMTLAGTAVGLPISWLATRMVRRSWFDGGVFNFGATNFGGIAVETVGNAPLLVWITSGILLPLVMILAIGALPAALRMAVTMPPRESTGMMLSASVAAGYMIGSAIAFYFALYSEIPPIMSTSEWTLTVLGVAVVRPVVWVYSGAFIGAVVWRYLRNDSLPGIALPALTAIAVPVAYTIASLAVASTGLWPAVAVGIILAATAVVLYTRVLHVAVNHHLGVRT